MKKLLTAVAVVVGLGLAGCQPAEATVTVDPNAPAGLVGQGNITFNAVVPTVCGIVIHTDKGVIQTLNGAPAEAGEYQLYSNTPDQKMMVTMTGSGKLLDSKGSATIPVLLSNESMMPTSYRVDLTDQVTRSVATTVNRKLWAQADERVGALGAGDHNFTATITVRCDTPVTK